MATNAQLRARRAADNIRYTAAFPLPVTAVANTDFIFTLPAGARHLKFSTKTSVAFGAVTDAQLSIGNAAAGAQYVAAVSVKAAGEVNHALVAGAMAELDTLPGNRGTETSIYARIAQTGGNSAVGTATLFVEYSLPVG